MKIKQWKVFVISSESWMCLADYFVEESACVKVELFIC